MYIFFFYLESVSSVQNELSNSVKGRGRGSRMTPPPLDEKVKNHSSRFLSKTNKAFLSVQPFVF